MSAAAYDLEEIIKLAVELGVERMKALKPELQAMAIRQKRPNPQELLMFVAQKLQEYPPEPWMRPDGSAAMLSPWLEMVQMNLAENAKEWAERIEKALGAETQMDYRYRGERGRRVA